MHLKMFLKNRAQIHDHEMYCQKWTPGHDETNEEFYTNSIASDDIWKKLDLLPTPPSSPRHEADEDDLCFLDEDIGTFLENDCDINSLLKIFPETPPGNYQNLTSQLIQDCMWSGLMVADLERAVHNGHIPASRVKNVPTSITNTQVDLSTTCCVDPATVFPYPMNQATTDMPMPRNLGTETPSDSEEEIDVVTLAERQNPAPRKMRMIASHAPPPSPESRSAVVQAGHNYSKQITTVIRFRQIHNSPPAGSATSHIISASKRTKNHLDVRPYNKKSKRVLNVPELAAQKLCSAGYGDYDLTHKYKPSRYSDSSRNGSDSEEGEGGNRTKHNVLERRRRNDLKSSFLLLRDSVPDLCTQDKAAKVVILRKAQQYIHRVVAEHASLVREFHRQQVRNEFLLTKLRSLYD